MVPDGEPTGVTSEMLSEENYPNLAESDLDDRMLPFLIRECAVKRLDSFRGMKRVFDRDGCFGNKGAILSE
jgi:hypothetical protein